MQQILKSHVQQAQLEQIQQFQIYFTILIAPSYLSFINVHIKMNY